MKYYILFFTFLFFCNIGFSQKSEVVFKSKNKHDYVVGSSCYIEDNIDTAKLMHMVSLRIISSSQDALISRAHNLLEVKTKEYNGNCYKLRSFSTKDTTLTMLFDVYFASEKNLDLMKVGRCKEKIIVFNNIKDTIFRTVYVNKKPASFVRKGHLAIDNIVGKEVVLQVDTVSKGEKELFRKEEKTIFYTVKLKERSRSLLIGAIGGAAGIAIDIYYLTNRHIDTKYEAFSKLSYSVGRILMEIYPQDKQILVN